jgi:hypothetical protein
MYRQRRATRCPVQRSTTPVALRHRVGRNSFCSNFEPEGSQRVDVLKHRRNAPDKHRIRVVNELGCWRNFLARGGRSGRTCYDRWVRALPTLGLVSRGSRDSRAAENRR